MKSPKIEFIARGLIELDGCVLLCRNVKSRYRFLPGGHIEYGESAATALIRELREETGIELQVDNLPVCCHEHVFCDDSGDIHHEFNLIFKVGSRRLNRNIAVPSQESKIAFDWIPRSEIATVSVRPASLASWLAEPVSLRSRWLSEIGE